MFLGRFESVKKRLIVRPPTMHDKTEGIILYVPACTIASSVPYKLLSRKAVFGAPPSDDSAVQNFLQLHSRVHKVKSRRKKNIIFFLIKADFQEL